MVKTIIWDFNGTILDDVSLCLDIEREMLRSRGMKHDYTMEEYKDMFVFPVIDYYKKLGYTFEEESYQDLSDVFNEQYDARYNTCGLVDGVLDKIQEAKLRGYRNVIVSATLQKTLEEQICCFGLTDYFDQLIGVGDNMAFSKIEYAKRWMEQSGTDPETCMLIGDSLHDLETAKALGVENVVLVACGHQSAKILTKEGVAVKNSMREVMI